MEEIGAGFFDKSARDSLVNFESGVGDVAISYENEVLVGQANGWTPQWFDGEYPVVLRITPTRWSISAGSSMKTAIRRKPRSII